MQCAAPWTPSAQYGYPINGWIDKSEFQALAIGTLRPPPTLRARHHVDFPMAKPNYSFEKRQRELAKKKKQEDKDARKRGERDETQPGEPHGVEPQAGTDAEP